MQGIDRVEDIDHMTPHPPGDGRYGPRTRPGGRSTAGSRITVLTLIQTLHFWIRNGGLDPSALAASPVQVRISYLTWLLVGLAEPTGLMHGIQLFATSCKGMRGRFRKHSTHDSFST
jgi:hypothetical protein